MRLTPSLLNVGPGQPTKCPTLYPQVYKGYILIGLSYEAENA